MAVHPFHDGRYYILDGKPQPLFFTEDPQFFARFFIFHLYESPKYLLGQGRDEQAVEVVAAVAKANGTTSPLKIEHLRACEIDYSSVPGELAHQDTSYMANIRRAVRKFSFSHIKALWSTPRLAYSTTLVVLLWGIIGLAYPLYNAFLPIYLANAGAQASDGSVYVTYRNYVIISVRGSRCSSDRRFVEFPVPSSQASLSNGVLVGKAL
jgi:hypothetical protein